jgi:TolA-binding protein
LDKELKKQIKEDEFKSALEHTAEWAKGHGAEVKITALVVAVLAAVLATVGYLRSAQRVEATEAFAAALETFNTPVAATNPAPTDAGKTFPSAQEKFTQALTAFDGLARKFPSRPEGRRARYFAALSRLELGQVAEAEKALVELGADRRSGELEPALARLALAELYRRSGQADKAVEGFRQIAQDPGSAVPRDGALMGLASTLEDAKKLAEAQAAYRRLHEEFPQSVYAAEARRRADRLTTVLEG